MGRPSKLNERKWAEVGRRLAAGEGLRALAKEYGVSHTAISNRFSDHIPALKTLASDLAAVETKLDKLPIADQATVRTIADRLKATAETYAELAERGARMANKVLREAEEVLDTEGLVAVQGLAVVAKVANDLSANAAALVKESKSQQAVTEKSGYRVISTGVPRG